MPDWPTIPPFPYVLPLCAMSRPRSSFKLRLFCRRECWVLTWQGWLLILASLGICLIFGITQLYPFLAVSQPITADTLVVEGWIHDRNLQAAATEYESHPYQSLLTTGVPLTQGGYLSQYKNYAELAAATFRQLQIPADQIIAVPAPAVAKDRTYTAAIALRAWLDHNPASIRAVNVLTVGAHARRTWLLYRKALAPRYSVGIIASSVGQEYNPKRWWASSSGFRSVTSEAIAYLYASIFNILD